MATPTKRKKPTKKAAKKRKGKIVVKEKVRLRKKNDTPRDTMPVQPPRDNGAVFKIKVRRK